MGWSPVRSVAVQEVAMTSLATPPAADPGPGSEPPHDPPTGPPPPSGQSARETAEELGARIQAQAALIAEATCELLLMVAEFDAQQGSGWFVGLKSTAHWLSWACSMAPGTAREHVRVARALPSMPLTVAEFRAGRLSYSKVREMTRVADRIDEERLVEMARAATASQLALMISSFRALDGSRLGQDAIRHAHWGTREDGMVEIRAVLPAELGAELLTALELAMARDGSGPPTLDDGTVPTSSAAERDRSRALGVDGLSEEEIAALSAEQTVQPTLEQRRADALHDLARTYLDAEPNDRSGEDRHLVLVQVSADALSRDVPAGTRPPVEHAEPAEHAEHAEPAEPAGPAEAVGSAEVLEPTAVLAPDAPADVPAGTPPVCHVVGAGPLEPRTAERLACTGQIALVITDEIGDVLHLGRSRRLASRAQRRALRLRDRTCVFPGCHQHEHLDAHHTTPWSEGGLTDIDGLALLCRRHHVMVHEGGLRLVRRQALIGADGTQLSGGALHGGAGDRFAVIDEDGKPVQARWPAMLEHVVTRPVHAQAQGAAPDTEPDPTRIASTTGGFGFRLADCVDALVAGIVKLAA